jgi:hypothetical protein
MARPRIAWRRSSGHVTTSAWGYIGFTIYSLPTAVSARIDYLQMIAEAIVARL